MKKALIIILLLAAGFVARGQEQVKFRFNPEYSMQDIRLEAGVFYAIKEGTRNTVVRGYYTHQFWNQLAYRVGGQLLLGDLGSGIGIPCGVALRPGVLSMKQSVAAAAEMAIFDSVWYGYHGAPEAIGHNVFMRFLMALFRRTEYHVGLTPTIFASQILEPGAHSRNSFLLTADAGFVLSIPIWRLCLNVSPTYHFALINTATDPARHLFSITGGVSYLF